MKISSYRYKGVLTAVFMLLIAFSSGFSAVVDSDMMRYKVIIDRKPFGYTPVEVNTDPGLDLSMQPYRSFTLDWTLSVVTTGPRGVRVGLRSLKTQRNYFVYVGDVCEDGVVVQDADYEKETVTLLKGDHEETLSLHSAPVMEPVASSRGSFSRAARHFRSSRSGDASRGLTKEEYERTKHLRPPPAKPSSSLRQKPERFRGLTKEEEDAELRIYNMDLIRAGGSAGIPLPLALTPEEDSQLVAEGVLPPL